MYLRLTKINTVVMPLTIWTSAGSSHDQIYTCTKPTLPKLLVNLKCFVCDKKCRLYRFVPGEQNPVMIQ